MLYLLSYAHHAPRTAYELGPYAVQRRPSYLLRAGGRDRLSGHPGVVDDVLVAEGLEGVAVRAGLRDEHRGAVVAQLGDRLADVGEGSVAAGLGGGVEVGTGVPATGQLLDRRHVDDPVVQP